jgi:hypothetical protein
MAVIVLLLAVSLVEFLSKDRERKQSPRGEL